MHLWMIEWMSMARVSCDDGSKQEISNVRGERNEKQ